jgi:RHS repeat-associated protein
VYDNNGNLTSDGINSYTWNARDQLVAISGGTTASFNYDAVGRRRSKTVGGASTGFLYDGLNLVQELNSGTPAANYLTGLALDRTYSRSDSTGTRSYLTDALGSTLGLTDSSGAITTAYSYDAYGNTTSSGASSANPLQYAGRENDGTGLYYNRARYYSPSLGRFISRDPIGLGGGINTYAYAGGAPTSLTDPTGLVFEDFGPTPAGLSHSQYSHIKAQASIPVAAVVGALGAAALGAQVPAAVAAIARGFRPNPAGLPPRGVKSPVEGCEVRPSTRGDGSSLWDRQGGEWRYAPENARHNPHWDYNPWDSWNSEWQNVPIANQPPHKPQL